MRIQVNNHYVGTPTEGRMIYPGVYEVGDPLLYGREEDLVSIGYATYLPEASAEESSPEGASQRRKRKGDT